MARDNESIPKVRIRYGAVAAWTRTRDLKFTIANQSPARLATAPQLGQSYKNLRKVVYDYRGLKRKF